VAAIFTSVIFLYTFNPFGQFLIIRFVRFYQLYSKSVLYLFQSIAAVLIPEQYTAVSCVDQGNSCCRW